MGWKIDQEKTIEVRKTRPQDENWNRQVKIYCSKDKKSFNLIPKEYQPLMKRFLGKVIGEFTCDRISSYNDHEIHITNLIKLSCVSLNELDKYSKGGKDNIYGWHITDLKIYDKPKELKEFTPICKFKDERCEICVFHEEVFGGCCRIVTRPPQSWCYTEMVL